MKKKKKPITTHGWLTYQADGIMSKIDMILEQNHIYAGTPFTLQISANVIRTICNITVIDSNGCSTSITAPLVENFNPFDNKSYWEKTEKIIMEKWVFQQVL